MMWNGRTPLLGWICFVVFTFVFTSSHVIGSSTNGSSAVDVTAEVDVLSANTTVTNVECVSSDDCLNGGSCQDQGGGGGNVCHCRNGTSGHRCQIVDDCVRSGNPKCGNDSGAKCVYNIAEERADCKCSDSSKAFDSFKKKCRVPCKVAKDCGERGGRCRKNLDNNLKFCSCSFGLGGDKCLEEVDECRAVGLDCGNNPNVTCDRNGTGNAVCYCRSWSEGFNYEAKDCLKCECGGSNLGCQFFPGGEKMCYCDKRHYDKDGKCKDCDCGFYFKGCKLEKGIKRCDCDPQFLDNNGKCEKCDCGKNSKGCTFKKGKKSCSCNTFYAQSDGTCKKTCWPWSSVKECQNGGECVGSLCECPTGTKGDRCEIVEGCEEWWEVHTKCGYYTGVTCEFNQTSGKPYCQCTEPNDLFDTYDKRCKECDCGRNGECHFNLGQKRCNCEEGFAERPPPPFLNGNSQCETCDCGEHSSGCKYASYYKKECSCESGYEQREFKCVECDCGPNGECSFDNAGRKVCNCEDGYSDNNGYCAECDCGSHGECVWDVFGKQSCDCQQGYGMKYGYCTRCTCYLNGEIGVNCTFTYGYQECTCPPGYEESDLSFCQEVNECRDSSICPRNTQCINTQGSYKCTCRKGYQPYTEMHDPMHYGCKDIDECSEQNECPFRDTTECVNTQGSYYCVCKSGHSAISSKNIEYEGCREDQIGWKVGYSILIVVFVIASVGLIIAIRKKISS